MTAKIQANSASENLITFSNVQPFIFLSVETLSEDFIFEGSQAKEVVEIVL